MGQPRSDRTLGGVALTALKMKAEAQRQSENRPHWVQEGVWGKEKVF